MGRRLVQVVLVALALSAGVLAYQVVRTGLALRDASLEAATLRSQVAAAQFDAADRTVGRLRDSARTAHDSSDGVMWAALTLGPLLGDDVGAVRDVAEALDEVVGRGADPLLETARSLAERPLRRDDGTFDAGAVAALQEPLERAESASSRADRTMSPVDPSTLVGPLSTRVAGFKQLVSSLHDGLRAGTALTGLLPGLLGVDGERHYLLVVQNNAEARATGGLPGSVSVLRARGGRLELGRQGSAADFGPPDSPPVAPLSPGERTLLGEQMATDFRDTNFTPDFPRAASLMAGMAGRVLDHPVDGVVSIDPVALAGILRATGPLDAAGTELDADNVVGRLLFEPYQRLADDREQNAYFAATSAAIFDALLQGDIDERAVLTELAGGVEQRRVTMWSSRPEEQRRLVEAGLGGELPRRGGVQPQVGLYLNSGTQAKIQYFLRYDASVRSVDCTRDGRQLVQARMRLTSTVPTPVSDLAPYVSGLGQEAPRGHHLLNLAAYAPAGGRLEALAVDGRSVDVATGEIDGRDVVVLPVRLGPGESTEVVADFLGARGQDGDPRVEWTPGLRSGPTERVARSACR